MEKYARKTKEDQKNGGVVVAVAAGLGGRRVEEGRERLVRPTWSDGRPEWLYNLQ